MKKGLFSLVLVLMLGFTGCTKAVPESGTANVPSIFNKTEKNSAQSESAEADTIEAVDAIVPLDIRVYTLNKNYINDDYETRMESEIDAVILSDEDALRYPELNRTLGMQKLDFEAQVDSFYERNLNDALEYDDYKYTYTDNVSISRNDGTSLALLYSGYEFLGGAHGFYWSYGYNYDVASGKLLKITDVVKDMDAFYKAVLEVLDSEYAKDLYDNYKDIVKENYEKDYDRYNWVLTRSGVDVIFTPYEIAPYASGQQVVNVNFSKYPDLFFDAYNEDKSGYIVETGMLSGHDFTGDGKADSFYVSYDYATEGPHEEWDEYGKWIFYVNDQKVYELGDRYFWDGNSYFIHTASGEDYVLLEERTDNDYTIWSFVKLKSDGFALTDSVFGYSRALDSYEYGNYEKNSMYVTSQVRPAFCNPDSMRLGVHTEILGTYTVYGDFSLSSDGKLEQKSDSLYYNFSYMPEWGRLTAKVDVSGKEVSEDGSILGDMVIPKGNILTYYRTDNKSWVDLKLSSGKIIRVDVKNEDWPKCINDTPVDDVFDGILWAG